MFVDVVIAHVNPFVYVTDIGNPDELELDTNENASLSSAGGLQLFHTIQRAAARAAWRRRCVTRIFSPDMRRPRRTTLRRAIVSY